MAPFISGLRWLLGKSAVTKIALSLCDISSEICVGEKWGGKKHGVFSPPRPFHKMVKMCSTDPKIFLERLLRTFRSHEVRFSKSTWTTLFFDAFKKKSTFFAIFYRVMIKCAAFFEKYTFHQKIIFGETKAFKVIV